MHGSIHYLLKEEKGKIPATVSLFNAVITLAYSGVCHELELPELDRHVY